MERILLFIVMIGFSNSILLNAQSAKKVNIPAKTIVDPQDTFPVPPSSPNLLFYLQRSANTNTVIYECNVDNKGKLVEKDPVHVFWIRYNEGSVKKELSYVQRVFAYGIKSQAQPDGSVNLHIVSYKKQNLVVKKSTRDHKYHAYAIINHREALLNRIFLKIDGGAFWSPNVIYIELKGKDEATGEELVERFKP
jgi:hypothetical protein